MLLILLTPLRRAIAALWKLLNREVVLEPAPADPLPLPQLATRIACRRET